LIVTLRFTSKRGWTDILEVYHSDPDPVVYEIEIGPSFLANPKALRLLEESIVSSL
jgi:hypothetical protein